MALIDDPAASIPTRPRAVARLVDAAVVTPAIARAHVAHTARAEGAAAAPWWTGMSFAYEPLGASSYADSLLDVTGNGSHAIEIVAPAFATNTGWTFNGSTHALSSSASIGEGSVVICYATLTSGKALVGANDGSSRVFTIYLAASSLVWRSGSTYRPGGTYAGELTTFALSATSAYLGGVKVVNGTLDGTLGAVPWRKLGIGHCNDNDIRQIWFTACNIRRIGCWISGTDEATILERMALIAA